MALTVGSVKNKTQYGRSPNGSAQVGILLRGTFNPKSTENIIARCSNIQWNIPFNITQSDEINTRTVKEINYGRQDIITGRIGLIMTLENNDQLPTSRTLKDDEEGYTLVIASGDDHKLTTTDSGGALTRVYSDVFVGVKIANESGGISVNTQRMTDISFVALDHFTGLEYRDQKGAGIEYPAVPAHSEIATVSI